MFSVAALLGKFVPSKKVSSDEPDSDSGDSGDSGDSLVSDVMFTLIGDLTDDNPVEEEEAGVDGWVISSDSDQNDFIEDETVTSDDLYAAMEAAKRTYPSASAWAEPEAALFEALFLRQDRPLLPRHWNFDFRGLPVPAYIFETSVENSSIIEALSGNDFYGTKALTRLIDLTADVRTTVQSGLRSKVPKIIKKGLERYITWAARDGGYSNRKYVPDIMVWNVPRRLGTQNIDIFMQTRMKSLARLQREYLRKDRNPNFWEESASPFLGSRRALGQAFERKLAPYVTTPQKRQAEGVGQPKPGPDATNQADGSHGSPSTRTKVARRSNNKQQEEFGDPSEEDTESSDGESNESYSPVTPPTTRYRRQPPVVYGLFIMGTSVFLLTLDSAKGNEGQVTFHIDLNLADSHQSVWNGLTLALVVCFARSLFMARMDDLEVLDERSESDSDK